MRQSATKQTAKSQTTENQATKTTLPERVMQSLENEIIAGKYAIGDKIPPEPELVQHFQVSRNSVREAMQSLIHAGILEARQGSGTYVVATSRLQVEIAKLCNQCEAEEINELRIILGKFLIKSASKKISRNEVKNLEDKTKHLKNYAKDVIQTSKINTQNSEPIKTTEDANNKPTVKTTKKGGKNLLLDTSDISQETTSQSPIVANISLLKALDHEYTLALTQGAHNNVIMPIFTYLQEQYLTRVVKENKDAWLNTIKFYGQLTDAIKNKDSKNIKKRIKALYK